MDDAPRPVSRQLFWSALVVVAVLAAAAGLGLSALVLGSSRNGPSGPAGATGPRGAAGAAGMTGKTGARGAAARLDNAAVTRAVESDPAAVARAIETHLTTDPHALCTDLKRVPALAHASLPC